MENVTLRGYSVMPYSTVPLVIMSSSVAYLVTLVFDLDVADCIFNL